MLNLEGMKIGRLTVLHTEPGTGPGWRTKWVCKCECGNTISALRSNLRSGDTTSCGCVRKERGAARLIDLTGKKFGKWTVINRKEGTTRWNCRCDCGTERAVVGQLLRTKQSTSCGCEKNRLTSERFTKDLTGKVFGRLTVLARDTSDGKFRWSCECSCGNVKSILGGSLTSGSTKSCGCYKSEVVSALFFKDLTGKKFNRLTAVRLSDKTDKYGKTFWVCKCDCGKETEVQITHLTLGHTKSCGCLSDEQKRARTGPASPMWKGGKYTDGNGYMLVWAKGHPNANCNNMVKEHILVMSEHLDRPLNDDETVHHKNGNKLDNRLENLELRLIDNHPAGITTEDAIAHALRVLATYKPDSLKQSTPSDFLPLDQTAKTAV